MTNPGWTYRWSRIAAAMLLGIAVSATVETTGARAADDDDEAFDTRIFRQVLQGLGLRRGDGPGIDYRERSPLVVPPGLNLPNPETGSAAEKNAAWPVDPDVKRAKEAKAERRKPRKDIESEESRPELPSQLGPSAASAPPSQRPTGESKDPTLPSTAAELKSKSVFTWDGLWGKKEESAKFTGEPPRASLTEPPAGYRTPSPTQPYGVGKAAAPAAINPMDTSQMRGTQ